MTGISRTNGVGFNDSDGAVDRLGVSDGCDDSDGELDGLLSAQNEPSRFKSSGSPNGVLTMIESKAQTQLSTGGETAVRN